MGVSGCGKTSVGEALSEHLPLAFVDGDTLHPPTNIAKMSKGEPLNDADRAPWLAEIGTVLADHEGAIVIGCSALKRIYRDWIRSKAGEAVMFLHLHADKSVLSNRVAERPGHFMPASLLDSQFDALEMLEADESGALIDIEQSFEDVLKVSSKLVREALG